MRIIDLVRDHEDHLAAAAELLMNGFAGTGTVSWQTPEAARLEVEQSLEEDRISRVAIDDCGALVGWIGAIREYEGHAWELHPLLVCPDRRRRGIGRALVRDLEEQVRLRGGTTIFLGTDDENCRTTIGGIDLYPDVLGALQRLCNLSDHPFSFYRTVGFVVVGVIPDANGLGKPDILMAKRVRP